MSIIEGWNRWFIYDRSYFSNRPKLEQAVMEYAEKAYLYCTVYEKDLNDMLSNIKAKHNQLQKENKRWSAVDIHFTGPYEITPDSMALIIGQQSLRLRKVKNEIESIDPVFPSIPL